ncbi:MAG TPA: FecR domain-containing protein [Puia sp.]|nr:FecR domain-containing protein [Puia sp.]
MPEKQRWRKALLAARKIFKGGPPRDAGREEQVPDSLIRDAMAYSQVDPPAAWDRLTEQYPELRSVPKDFVFPRPPVIIRIFTVRQYRPWAIAACLILLVLVGLSYPIIKAILNRNTHMTTTTRPHRSDTIAVKASFLQPGSYQLSLTIPDNKTIDAAALPHKDTSIYNKVVVRREGQGTLVYKTFHPPGKAPSIFTLSTPNGGWYTVVLPDRTQVTLNAATIISFTSAFGSRERVLTLGGEAYIQTRNQQPGQPSLLIKLIDEGVTLRVPPEATFLNITAYDKDHDTRVTILKGAMEVEDSAIAETVKLVPGDQYRTHGRDRPQVFHHVDTAEAIAWTTGWFTFNRRPIQEIMRPIARWYDAEVIYDEPPPGTFSVGGLRTWPIKDILQLLRSTKKVDFYVDRNQIHVTRWKP